MALKALDVPSYLQGPRGSFCSRGPWSAFNALHFRQRIQKDPRGPRGAFWYLEVPANVFWYLDSGTRVSLGTWECLQCPSFPPKDPKRTHENPRVPSMPFISAKGSKRTHEDPGGSWGAFWYLEVPGKVFCYLDSGTWVSLGTWKCLQCPHFRQRIQKDPRGPWSAFNALHFRQRIQKEPRGSWRYIPRGVFWYLKVPGNVLWYLLLVCLTVGRKFLISLSNCTPRWGVDGYALAMQTQAWAQSLEDCATRSMRVFHGCNLQEPSLPQNVLMGAWQAASEAALNRNPTARCMG